MRGGGTRNALMIAFAFSLPYHVMRCAAAAGVRVHVLGNGASRGLRMSRHCRGYHESHSGGDPESLLGEIRDVVKRYDINIVFPSDDVSTRLLSALGDRLPVRTSPVPALATFDLLNDKWSFTRFCAENGVRAPQGWLLESGATLRQGVQSGEIALPLTVKPINRSGGFGVIHIREAAELAQLDAADYRPLLAQRHIAGETIGISVLCEHGRVVAHAVQRRDTARFALFDNPDLLANVRRLASLTGFHGPANLDAVMSDDGLSYIVECNPRFWYTISLSMVAGLNFVGLALSEVQRDAGESVALRHGEVRLAFLPTLLRPWRATPLDRKFVAYNLGDPIAYLLQRANAYDDSEVAVPVAQMAAHAPPKRVAA
jgi:ATP-grasp in the biosynthetic pathway with Ter operon